MAGKVGNCIESVDVERVLPIGTSQEKRMRFSWEQIPSDKFLMSWNQFMEPNSMFIERVEVNELVVTVRWGLMKQPPEKIRDLLNTWLAQVESETFRPSGNGGRRI